MFSIILNEISGIQQRALMFKNKFIKLNEFECDFFCMPFGISKPESLRNANTWPKKSDYENLNAMNNN